MMNEAKVQIQRVWEDALASSSIATLVFDSASAPRERDAAVVAQAASGRRNHRRPTPQFAIPADASQSVAQTRDRQRCDATWWQRSVLVPEHTAVFKLHEAAKKTLSSG